MKRRSNYGPKRRIQGADRYGSYNSGILVTPETIAGTTITKQLPTIASKDQ